MKESLLSALRMMPAPAVILDYHHPSQAVPAAPVKLNIFSSSHANSLFNTATLQPRIKEVEETANGRVKITGHASHTLARRAKNGMSFLYQD
jgi:hypothetical protein